ncbi:MAG TPA: acylphosphatase [Sphingomicrobium sp.]|nr:acylphosphatase [Sphingomicrobium sp.]
MAELKIARHVRIGGRVQGVFFRAWSKEQAERLGVSGWIRNCPDGSVEAHVEGSEQSIDRLVGLLRGGPPGARVDDLQVREAELLNPTRFEVRR